MLLLCGSSAGVALDNAKQHMEVINGGARTQCNHCLHPHNVCIDEIVNSVTRSTCFLLPGDKALVLMKWRL